MKPRLSICIATRNRARFLESTLAHLGLVPGQPVEVVILDGASTDDTTAVVEQARAALAPIRYQRQEVNGGVDRDYASAVALASGDYCWLMSDDDYLAPGAIGRVLAALAGEPSLVVVNAELRTPDMTAVLDPSRLGFSDDRCYEPGEHDRLFADTAGYLTFIGGVVVRRDVWMARARERYFGSGFAHLGVLFESPLPAAAIAIGEPLIQIRHGNISWSERAFSIWMFDLPGLIWSLDSVSERAREAVTPREPWRSPRNLLIYRTLGAYTKRELQRFIAPANPPFRVLMMAGLIARLPGPPLNLAAVLYCLATRSRVALFSLQASRYYLPRLFRKRSR